MIINNHTLSLESVQVMPECVCWFSLLQDTEVTQFLHLCFLSLSLPHCDHDLKENKCTMASFKVLSELQYICKYIKTPKKQTDSL